MANRIGLRRVRDATVRRGRGGVYGRDGNLSDDRGPLDAFVAQHVAVAAPERVKRLVLSGSATTVRNSVVSDLQREVNALKDPIPEKFVRDFQVGMAFQPLTDEFKQSSKRV